MATGLFLALTIDKPINKEDRPTFAAVALWCLGFDVLFLIALFTV